MKKDFINVNFKLCLVMEMENAIQYMAVNVLKVGWENCAQKNHFLVYLIKNHVIIMELAISKKVVSAKKVSKVKIVKFWDLIVV